MNASLNIDRPAAKTGCRILSLWFPYLATERIWRQRLGLAWRTACSAFPPLGVSHSARNAKRLAALDRRAEALNLRRGMGVAEARAMRSGIDVVEADPEADRRLLEALADWCDRYTPLVALDGADGLFLDISGCCHLFGGEQALLEDMVRRFRDQGFDARAAIAATAGAAWAVARFHGSAVVPEGMETEWLSPLPPAALRLEPEICTALDSVGLRTAGALRAAPRAPLARRFGKALLLRLDQALGHLEEALSPRLAVAELSAERRLAEPIVTVEDVERVVLILARSLRTSLEQRGAGALALQLLLFRVDGAVARLPLGLSSPTRAPERIARLFHERLDALARTRREPRRDLTSKRDEEREHLVRAEGTEPRYAEREAHHRARESGERVRIGEGTERRRDHHPRHVLARERRSGDVIGDCELDLTELEHPRDAIEERANRVRRARLDPVAGRRPQLREPDARELARERRSDHGDVPNRMAPEAARHHGPPERRGRETFDR